MQLLLFLIEWLRCCSVHSKNGPIMSKANVFHSGWLEKLDGGDWKRQFVVLEILKMGFCASDSEADQAKPLSQFVIALVESMNVEEDAEKKFQVVLKSKKETIKLNAPSAEERDEWVSTLRALIPKAKVLLNKRALDKKAKAQAAHEQLLKSATDAVESLQTASGRVRTRGSFKIYADALCDRYRDVLKVLDDGFGGRKHESVKGCVDAVSAMVDLSNSTAAICANAALRNDIGAQARDIASDSANIIPVFAAATFAATGTDDDRKQAEAALDELLAALKLRVEQSLEHVQKAAILQQQLDDAKREIEAMFVGESAKPVKSSEPIDAQVDKLEEQARALRDQLRQIENTAVLDPHKLGEDSAAVAKSMQQLVLDTHAVAYSCGIDPSAADPFAECDPALSEHRKQQLRSMLNAAKSFAAGTSNIIDVLKQLPNQEQDENIRHQLKGASSSAQYALDSLVSAAQSVEPAPSSDSTDATAPLGGAAAVDGDEDDGESALLDVLATLQAAADSMRASADAAAAAATSGSEDASGSGAVHSASSVLTDATVALVKAAAEAQKKLKTTTSGEVYRKDPEWTRGLIAAARVVADTTAQLGEVSSRDDASPSEVVAAARCVNGATARLVAISRSKGDPELHRAVEAAAKGIGQATNQLVTVANAKKAASGQSAEEMIEELLKGGSRGAQIRAEFEAQAKIAALEHDLDDARQMLAKLRRAVYGKRG